MGMDSYHFRVTGRVQGVGFRWFTRDKAESLALSGWVQNEADGSVSGGVCGPADKLTLFFRALEQGPPHGKVEHLTRQSADFSAGGRFEIRR